MPIVKAKDHIDAYRRRALHEPLSTLSGRYESSTEFICANILEALALQSDDRFLDVGCGDGTLLAMAVDRVAKAVGMAPTKEEVAALDAAHDARLHFICGLAEALPDEFRDFDKIVINGVFLLLPDDATAAKVMDELHRVTAPGGLVWAGEIVISDEIAERGGESLLRRMLVLLGHGKFRALLRRAKRVLQGVVLGREITLVPKRLLYFTEQSFADTATSAGFEIVEIRSHFERSANGHIYPVPSRKNFLLRRPNSSIPT